MNWSLRTPFKLPCHILHLSSFRQSQVSSGRATPRRSSTVRTLMRTSSRRNRRVSRLKHRSENRRPSKRLRLKKKKSKGKLKSRRREPSPRRAMPLRTPLLQQLSRKSFLQNSKTLLTLQLSPKRLPNLSQSSQKAQNSQSNPNKSTQSSTMTRAMLTSRSLPVTSAQIKRKRTLSSKTLFLKRKGTIQKLPKVSCTTSSRDHLTI